MVRQTRRNADDWLVIKGTTTERADQRGLITEVHGWMACDSSSAWCAKCGMTRLVHKSTENRLCPDSAQSRWWPGWVQLSRSISSAASVSAAASSRAAVRSSAFRWRLCTAIHRRVEPSACCRP